MLIETLNSPCRAFLGHECCRKGHRFGPAIREYFLLHFVIRGKGRLYTRQGEYTLEKGEGFLLSPGEVSTYVADKDDPWEYVWVGVGATNETEEILRRHGLEIGAHCFVFHDEAGVIPTLIGLVSNYQLNSYEQAMGAFYLLMGTVALEENERSGGRYLEKCYDYMEKHYTDALTVEAMAKHLHMSRSYLYRIFKQNLGISPQRAILNFRLEKASMLVERGGIPLTEIALSCGFYDLSHFSKAYKERYEQYPKAEKEQEE